MTGEIQREPEYGFKLLVKLNVILSADQNQYSDMKRFAAAAELVKDFL
jgi:hypothetical protein